MTFPGDIQDAIFKTPEDFLRDKPYNVKMQLKFVMSEDLPFF